MQVRKRFVASVVTGVIAASGLIATTAGQASAAGACLDNAQSYTKASGTHLYPNYPTLNYLLTSANCADINIKTNTERYVKVCFLPSSGGRQCQAEYKLAKADTWMEIATDVKDNTRYQFYFRSDASSSGQFAD
ncbi:hypothetical protein K4B79_46835 [Streptomyces lincolnensis]|uniref:hypothetical protein n=1 Tax=Streptomyces lincolnensis TaxID=1915 RepID=UPI001E637D85|nr:hypothetical protein [Streptomyces lincolnensis]MCD7445679.1 hypothetical protein [Streptomyces lincolnensis]